MNKPLTQIERYAQQLLATDTTGHDFTHTKRVVTIAQRILLEEPTANSLIVLTAAYLHDVIDDKVVDNQETAKKEVIHFLQSLDFSAEMVMEILFIMEHLSFSANLERKIPLSLEGQIVQDADRLDALGAWGILRTAYYGGAKGHPIYLSELSPKKATSKEDYRKNSSVINHFYEKLFLLPDQMNTPYAKKEGRRRVKFMEEFIREFEFENQN